MHNFKYSCVFLFKNLGFCCLQPSIDSKEAGQASSDSNHQTITADHFKFPYRHPANVIVIPDRDAIGQWRDSITKMTDLANFIVSDFCEEHAIHDAPKCDIADILIEERRCQQQA